MTTTTHTPGPWKIGRYRSGGRGTSRTIWRGDDNERNTNWALIARHIHNPADAALIAAAPELLAALEDALTLLSAVADLAAVDVHPDKINAVCDAAADAIAKARGEA